jgi:hypothetical protein
MKYALTNGLDESDPRAKNVDALTEVMTCTTLCKLNIFRTPPLNAFHFSNLAYPRELRSSVHK